MQIVDGAGRIYKLFQNSHALYMSAILAKLG